MTPSDDHLFDWRRGGAAAIALVATLVLLGMVVLVAITNSARDEALRAERHAYDVTLYPNHGCKHCPGRGRCRAVCARR